MNHTDTENCAHGDRLSRRRSRLHIVLISAGLIGLGVVLGALGAASTNAFAAFGGHFGGHHGKGPVTLEQMRERAGDKLEWMLSALDASPEQTRAIQAVGLELVTDLYPLRQQHREHRRQILSQLTAAEPDATVLEDLRRQELQLADAASARVLAAVLQGSGILTTEQRDRLARHFRHRRH